MDSIRGNRTKEDVVAELTMMFNADIEGKMCAVIVEGSDDVRFMEIVLEENVICVESPYGGKHGLDDLMAEPTIQKKPVIAVRDRDYMDIEQLEERKFVYDGCCLETMILSNPDIAKKFHANFYQGKLTSSCYLIDIMRQLAPYSVLRKENELRKHGIRFAKAGIGNLIEEEKLQIEILFEKVHQSEKLCSCSEKADKLENLELWNITNGHDFCTYLGCLSGEGKRTLGESGVKNKLFVMYQKEDFETTKLYSAVLSYQNKNKLKFVSG